MKFTRLLDETVWNMWLSSVPLFKAFLRHGGTVNFAGLFVLDWDAGNKGRQDVFYEIPAMNKMYHIVVACVLLCALLWIRERLCTFIEQ